MGSPTRARHGWSGSRWHGNEAASAGCPNPVSARWGARWREIPRSYVLQERLRVHLDLAHRSGVDRRAVLLGVGPQPRCAEIGSKLKAGTTRSIQYPLVPKKQGGKRTKIFYKVTVTS
jgi:hypothetical protein